MTALPLCVAAAAFIVAVGLPSGDPDMWWHLASGRWMIDHGELLKVDIFSSTATGRPYAVGEWLGQIALAAVHGAAGWTGVAVLRAALVAVAAFSLTRVALRAAAASPVDVSPMWRGAIAISLVAVALALSTIAWTDRPQLVTIALFPVLLDLLFAARAGGRRALFVVPPLLFAWSDLHAGYALGLVVVSLFAADAALARRDAGAFALAATVSFAVVVANPGAIGVLPATAHVATAPRIIVEESPPDVLTAAGAVFGLFAVAVLAALLLRGGPLLAVLLLVPLLWLALSAQRHMVFFVFAAVPFLTEASTSRWDRARGRREGVTPTRSSQRPHERGVPDPSELRLIEAGAPREGARARRPLAPGVAALLWIAAFASIPLTAPTAPDESLYPRGALPALRASSGVLIHEYDWGGYLIWNAPERPVFVDGRLRPFVPDILDDHLRATLVRPGWMRVLDEHGVRQALLSPERPLAAALRDEGWTVLAEGERFVLLERPR
ncbi:MAG: hypothetical protein ACRDGT_01790 [Candidatus Limnocylindria bacterium]